MCTIRPATKDQVPQIAQVVNWAYRGKNLDGEDDGAWTTERHLIDGIRTTELGVLDMLSSVDRNGPGVETLLVALGTKKRVIGTIHSKLVQSGVVEFGFFSVDPDLQASGVGTNLLQAAERNAHWKMDAKVAIMYVISMREELLKWYARLGYHATKERVPFPPPEADVGVPRQPGLEFVMLQKKLDWDAGS